MQIKRENGTSLGPGVSIELTGSKVATAIDSWLVAHGVHVSDCGHIYVDASGCVMAEGEKVSGLGILIGHGGGGSAQGATISYPRGDGGFPVRIHPAR